MNATRLAQSAYRDQSRSVRTDRGLADPQNPLPQSLRAQVVYLAQFCHHHSSAVLNANASLQPLIDINTAIMRGLSDRRAAQ